MAHLIVECSEHVVKGLSVDGLCQTLHGAMVECKLFPLAGIRVRAYQPLASAIADKHPQNGFVALTLIVGHGRTKEELSAAGAIVFEAAKETLMDFLAEPYFGLSLEIREINPDLTWKANSIRPRLQSQSAQKV